MRDPRNWVRPAAALFVGGTAATALVLLRARRREQAERQLSGRSTRLRESAGRTLEDLRAEAHKLLGRRSQ
jgi:hypothetical protein